MSDMDELIKWVKDVTDNLSWRAIGESLGTTHSTIQRRLKTDTASVVVEIARTYNANPIHGLLAGGCITYADIRAFQTREGLADFTDLELSEEIVHRLRERQTSEAFEATVFEFPQSQSAPADIYDGTVTQWRDTTHAADSSPDETEERLTRGEDPID